MEGGRVRGEEEASASRRTFWRPSRGPSEALVVLVRYLRGPLLAQSCGKGALHTTITGRDGDDTTCESRHSSVWYSLSCVDSVRAHLTLKNHILAEMFSHSEIALLLQTPLLPHTSRTLREKSPPRRPQPPSLASWSYHVLSETLHIVTVLLNVLVTTVKNTKHSPDGQPDEREVPEEYLQSTSGEPLGSQR